MFYNLLTEHYLEFLRFKRGYTGSCESTLVKNAHCWKSHVMARHVLFVWIYDWFLCFFLTFMFVSCAMGLNVNCNFCIKWKICFKLSQNNEYASSLLSIYKVAFDKVGP